MGSPQSRILLDADRAGPGEIDLIFVGQGHEDEPPWEPSRENLEAIDAHFWDWML